MDGNDLDGVYALGLQLQGEKLGEESSIRHTQLLRGKLEHIIDHIDSPPSRIVSHIKVYFEHQPDLFKDTICIKTLKKLIKVCKRQGKKTSMISSDSSSPLTVLIAKILFSVYLNQEHWPLELLEIYIEDSLGPRQWIDSLDTVLFTQNLLHWTNPECETDRNIATSINAAAKSRNNYSANSINTRLEPEINVLIQEKKMNSPQRSIRNGSKVGSNTGENEEEEEVLFGSDGDSSGDEEVLEESASICLKTCPSIDEEDVRESTDFIPTGSKSEASNPNGSYSSTNSPINMDTAADTYINLPDIFDRFSLIRTAARAMVFDFLNIKSGNGSIYICVRINAKFLQINEYILLCLIKDCHIYSNSDNSPDDTYIILYK